MSSASTAASDVRLLDVAIVGAGVSGVYSAWRLKSSDAYRSGAVEVFELSDRVGGRLVSATPPGMPRTVVELGGMRFFDSQAYVNALVRRELQLDVVELPADEPENLAYFRGRRFRRYQLTGPPAAPGSPPLGYRASGGYQAPPGFPYAPGWEEAAVAPTDLLVYAVMVAVPEWDPTAAPATQAQVLRRATVDGKPLKDWGFWNLLSRVMTREAYFLLRAVVGYDSTFLNWNAFNSIFENLDFSPSVKKYRVVKGYDEVPRKLAERFLGLGGTIHYEHCLRSLDVVPGPGDGDRVVATFRTPTGDVTVAAKRLVLAMPRRSLEALQRSGAVLDRRNTEVHEKLRTVTPDPLFKIALAYPHPWWESYGLSQGRSLSDQPIRQCYYWSVESEQPGGEPANHNSLLMLYNDSESIDFFAGFMGSKDRFTTRKNPFVRPGQDGSADWKRLAAPARLVAAAHGQVVELHDAHGVPQPYAAAAAEWNGFPFGGGANFWNPYVDSTEMIPEVAQPRAGLPVYIVGEAYSESQSWVEGALETSELVLTQHFGLPKAPYLADGEP